MKISEELTYAEVRMLYLLLTEPSISELSQQDFANKIQVNRRTYTQTEISQTRKCAHSF